MDKPTEDSWYGRSIPKGSAAPPFGALPVIDLSPFRAGDRASQQIVSNQIREASLNIGFFYISGHGVENSTLEKTIAIAREFFSLPHDEKLLTLKSLTPGYGGFSPMLDLDYGDPVRASLVESFNMNLELPADHRRVVAGEPLYHPNSWPSVPTQFRPVIVDWFDQMRAVGDMLFEAFAMALDLTPDYFIKRSREPIALMRINHYPPQPPGEIHESIGAAPHTDYECFTILAQEGNICALEVVGPDDRWLPVPPIPGTFVINVGDQLSRITNDRFRSTVHRVINTNPEDRCSIAFFQGLDADTLLEVPPDCLDQGEKPRYAPITAGDFVANRVADVYGYGLDQVSR